MNDDNLKNNDKIEKVKLNIEKLHSEKEFKTVSTKEALRDVSPIKWNENVYNGEMKVIIGSNIKKLYKGWEIIKLLSEGKLKEGTKLINNNNWVYEVKYDGESYYIKNEEEWDVSVSYFTNDTHFRILEE